MEQQFSEYYEDLVQLSDCLGDGLESQWSHKHRKQLLLLIHKLKNLSRTFSNSEIEVELIAIEVTLGFGSGAKESANVSLIEDHQLRLLELSEIYRNNIEEDDSNSEVTDEGKSLIFEPDNIEPGKIEIHASETVSEIQGIQLILCNCPDRDTARELAHSLIKKRMAACVNIIANIGSIYWWDGEIQDTAECQLQIKTAVTPVDEVINFIRQNHPNDVPEILIMPINKGNEDYFDWVRQESKQQSK